MRSRCAEFHSGGGGGGAGYRRLLFKGSPASALNFWRQHGGCWQLLDLMRKPQQAEAPALKFRFTQKETKVCLATCTAEGGAGVYSNAPCQTPLPGLLLTEIAFPHRLRVARKTTPQTVVTAFPPTPTLARSSLKAPTTTASLLTCLHLYALTGFRPSLSCWHLRPRRNQRESRTPL